MLCYWQTFLEHFEQTVFVFLFFAEVQIVHLAFSLGGSEAVLDCLFTYSC